MALLACSKGSSAFGYAGRLDPPKQRPGLLRSRRFFRASVVAILALLFWPAAALKVPAQTQSASEYELKAAFLFQFAKFVDWPSQAFSDPSAPICIGIIGHDPFGWTIDQTVQGKTANGRPFVIKRLKSGDDLRGCHILFISSSENKRLPQILGAINGGATLTVADMDGFSRSGGMINLLMENNRVRFQVNVRAAERAHLKISSKLLQLAKEVFS